MSYGLKKVSDGLKKLSDGLGNVLYGLGKVSCGSREGFILSQGGIRSSQIVLGRA